MSGADPGMNKRGGGGGGGGGTLLLVVEGSAQSAQSRGVWGHAPPGKCGNLGLLRWILR